jgi:hypothetical protein
MIFTLMASCHSIQAQNSCDNFAINIYDSVNVKDFCANSDLCCKLILLRKYKTAFCLNKGYVSVVLSSVSKELKRSFFFPIATGGVVIPLKARITNFNNEMNPLQGELCRPPRSLQSV